IEDAQDFSSLVLISAPIFFPLLFGHNVQEVMKNLFRNHSNIFSFQHSYFIELDGRNIGMALGYTWNEGREEGFNTGMLLVKYLKWDIITQAHYLLKAREILGEIIEGDYYISNIAVYPEFRGLGLGTKLLEKMEDEAKETDCKRMILDLETENKGAMALYKRLGYDTEKESSTMVIRGKRFKFLRMRKIIKRGMGG
ncbi:MAG: GNAT family N-acetyltransferase, partial [bacterium]